MVYFYLFASVEESVFPDVAKDKGVQQACLLLNYLLDCLHKCLMYDTHGFLDSDRFQCLMQPLVDQVLRYIVALPGSQFSQLPYTLYNGTILWHPPDVPHTRIPGQ